ncbi:cupin domain-containing protein [Halosimplex salinum]|uniref:cupin domain-containing protein n=1 Tax=Halosimplex salinum TaxID=1710538 RepID=UPI000F46BBC9|nr:cupin domain-containing protein [Halosimplex salinum]
MGYHVVDPDDLEPEPDRPSEMRYVSKAAGMERMGVRTYTVRPGEEIPLSGMHYHDEQEEVFFVRSGTLSVETPDELYTVESGQFFVAEPGSPHRAHVADDAGEPASVLGLGAPPVSDGHSYEGE